MLEAKDDMRYLIATRNCSSNGHEKEGHTGDVDRRDDDQEADDEECDEAADKDGQH